MLTFENGEVINGEFNGFQNSRGIMKLANDGFEMGCFVKYNKLLNGIIYVAGGKFQCPEYGCASNIKVDSNRIATWMQSFRVVNGKATATNEQFNINTDPKTVCPNWDKDPLLNH